MSKIPRVTLRQFGSSPSAFQVEQFGSLAAGSPNYTTNITTLQSLSAWIEGWFGAVVGSNAPAIQDMNAVLIVFGYMLSYVLQEGVAEYDSGTTYFIGSMVQDSTNLIYVSLTDSNTGNALSDTTNWQVYGSNFKTKTAIYTVAFNDQFIRGNTTAGAFTVTLPAVASSTGMKVVIKNVGTVAAGNNLTIQANAAETVDGANTQVLAPFDSMTLFCNGTTWDII